SCRCYGSPYEAARVPEGNRHVAVRRAVAALAVGDDFFVRRDAGLLVHGFQLGVGFKSAVGGDVVRPLDVHRARNRAAARRAHVGAEVFAPPAGIEDGNGFFVERAKHVVGARQHLAPLGGFEHRRFGCGSFRGHRRAGGFPGLETAVEHFDIRMPVIFQKPQAARRAHAGVVLVKDDFFRFADTAQLEHVMDHEHERLERRVAGVDEAQAEKIEMGRAGDMAAGVVFGRTHVDDTEIFPAELWQQFAHGREQGCARVLLFHRLPITLVEMALQIMRWRAAAAALAGATGLLVLAGFAYEPAVPGRKITFPADHYSHPDFQTEWWYYTGHLQTESGRRYGYQVTFFRFGVRDRQQATKEPPLFSDLYMAHFALSDIEAKKFTFRERINRGLAGRAGAATNRYLVWNENWRVAGDAKNHAIAIEDRGTRLRLSLQSLKPPVLHGENGLSQKAEGRGRASYYYSLTRLRTDGELSSGKTEKVRGLSWMDHEFGSNQLGADQVGWDWFSLQLDNDTEIMLYLMRRKDGSADPYS